VDSESVGAVIKDSYIPPPEKLNWVGARQGLFGAFAFGPKEGDMKKFLFISLVAISIAVSQQVIAADDFDYDHGDVASYGAGILKSLVHSAWASQASIDEFDLNKPVTESIHSKSGKRYVFVGYKNATGNGGFMLILQVCDNGKPKSWIDYAVADYGLVLSLDENLGSIRALRQAGQSSLDIPDACPISDRD
jgi:hypothetical protein